MSDKQCEKIDIYECAFFKYEYDEFGKYCLCHCKNMPSHECSCHYIYAQQFCPCFDKGRLRGRWAPTEAEIECAKKFEEQTSKVERDMKMINEAIRRLTHD